MTHEGKKFEAEFVEKSVSVIREYFYKSQGLNTLPVITHISQGLVKNVKDTLMIEKIPIEGIEHLCLRDSGSTQNNLPTVPFYGIDEVECAEFGVVIFF